MENDFNVKLTVRSERILNAISERFGTQMEMARNTGISTGVINSFVCMRVLPVGVNGWTDSAETFAAALGVYPSDIWPDHMREVRLKTATAELSMSIDDVQKICAPDKSDNAASLIEFGEEAMNDRHRIAIRALKEGWTLEELGSEIGVSRERARQIQFRAMSKMRAKFLKIGVRSIGDAL